MIDYPKLACIVARARNGVIGRDGDLPWKLSSDLKFFKRTTMGKPVLMGRKTWESLPFPLPGRPNLVLTRQADYSAKGAEVLTDLRRFVGRGYELAGALGASEVMVIGGGGLYRALMPWMERVYVTEVHADVDGDTVFPRLDTPDWFEVSREDYPKTDKDDYAFSVRVLERVSPSVFV